MGFFSSLWTLALIFISAVAVTLAMIAYSHQSWITLSCLVLGLLFSTTRLVLASRVNALEKKYSDESSSIWNGEEIAVGFGIPFYFKTVLACGVCALMAVLFLSIFDSKSLLAWGFLLASILLPIFTTVSIARNPGIRFKVNRHGVWDQKFDLIPWSWVQKIDFIDISVRSQRINALVLCLTEQGMLEVSQLRRQPRTIYQVARLGANGAKLEYNLMSLGVHPYFVRTVAENWWRQHSEGREIVRVDPKSIDALSGRLTNSLKSMPRYTRLAVLFYLLVPLALFADVWFRTSKW